MNRKTNLFYNANSQDSNFITFSNYTESLTGNFLSTDTKLFPSTFLCLKIPKLYATNDLSDGEYFKNAKQEFIQNWLIRRYENKLAFLRDYCKREDDLVESRLLPLNYLLEYIYEYDPETEITYIDNITEQDYNGTYTDTICIINSTKFKHAELVVDEALDVDALYADYKYTDKDKQRYDYSKQFLYGWYNKGTEQYQNNFDINCDGHVTRSDMEEFTDPDNEERIKKCIRMQLEVHQATVPQELVNEMYVTQCEQIRAMVEHNEALPETWVGPNYYDIKEVVRTIDGECNCPPGTCLIDENDKCCCQIINSTTERVYEVSEESGALAPIFDYPTDIEDYESSDCYYKITSNLSKIILTTEDAPSNTNNIKTIEFNVIIPLYDVIDMNSTTNSYIINEVDEISLQNNVADPCLYIKNVPMGMWFSGQEPVILKRDLKSKYCPSWSLVIGSQFKPFPYSKEMPDEITSSAKADAFMTFAEILTRQNEMIDKMGKLFDMMNSMNSRLNDIESNIMTVPTGNNLDSLRHDMINLEQYINGQLSDIRNTLNEYNLVWVNREG